MLYLALGFFLFSQMTGTGTGGTGTATTGQPTTPQSVLERPVISEEYILMPGDGCLTTISGGTNYTYHFTISYEGKAIIMVPVSSTYSPILGVTEKNDVVDAVYISGLSIKAAEDSLSKVFKKYFKNVSVELTLVGMRTFNVFVSGEVRNPGVVYAWPVDRVSEIIKRAGGVTALGSRGNIQLNRGDKIKLTVDLEKFELTGNLSVNPYVQDGDLIIVPIIKGLITVKGAVYGRGLTELRTSAMTTEREKFSEGMYELREGDRVSDLVTRAGGITPWAELEVCYIERLTAERSTRVKIAINLYDVLINKNETQNLEMVNGDILVIPSKSTYVYVLGEVEKPGSFIYQPNLRMSDYIAMAGVKTEAKISGSKLTRGKEKFKYKQNPIVEPGDEIKVPRVLLKFWQDYVYIASVGATLLISYLTLQAK